MIVIHETDTCLWCKCELPHVGEGTAEPYFCPESPAGKRIAELEAVLESLRTWVEYYPLKIFPEPDMKLAMRALNVAGITLDAVSASAMRHVLKQIAEMIDKAQPAPHADTEQE